jgi:FkbM family methyltransferase
MIKDKIQRLMSKLGYVLVEKNVHMSQKRYYRQYIRHANLIKSLELDCIIDVGAHEGGFAEEMFNLGYMGKMISFEPIYENYKILEKKARDRKNWQTHHMALGSFNGEDIINVSENLVSSSILDINQEHTIAAPESYFKRKETIIINKLDDVLGVDFKGNKGMLKIDTQGFEMKVLEGATETLKKIKAVKVELSSIALYEGSPLFFEVAQFLYENNFLLASVENGFYNSENFRLLQFDGLFVRKVIC